MYCHICNDKLPYYFDIVKCKLCCDGLEQDFCETCSELYYAYKQGIRFVIPESHPMFGQSPTTCFKQLQARRQVAVNRTRFRVIQGGKT